MAFTLTSTAFSNGGEIPIRHTRDGADMSPPLSWANVPDGTKSLVLVVEDPDAPDPAAPQRTWVHWIVYNLPPHDSGLKEGAVQASMPTGAEPGVNDWGESGYGGPQPPIGRHRYFHRLYALDTVLPELNSPDRRKLDNAMQGHVIATAELVGTYQH